MEEKFPAFKAALEEILRDEVAGDPMGEQTWVRSSTRRLAARLRDKGFPLSNNTVWHLLKRMGFSMRTSVRKRRGVTRDLAARDAQFRYIAAQKEKYAAAGLPAIETGDPRDDGWPAAALSGRRVMRAGLHRADAGLTGALGTRQPRG
jgi:hypothetical protein